jgi:predicted nucleotidyltransferase
LSPILEAALEIQSFCKDRGWRFCFIGGIVVPRWGEPRTTADADLTLLTGFGGEEAFVDVLLASFRSRRTDTRTLALERRVVLIEARNTVPLDVSLGALPFEERLLERSSDFVVAPGTALRTCSAEDLVVLKAFAGRDLDWADIRGVAVRQAGLLDEGLIFRELEPLLELKGTPEAATRLRQILRQGR